MSPSVFLLLSLFAVVAFSQEYYLQFSHQAPNVVASVDLRVNGVPVFQGVSYGNVAGFQNITRLARDGDEPGAFNLTLLISATEDVLSSEIYTFEEEHSSYYVVGGLTGAFEVLFLADDFSQPEQLQGLWRVAHFAPVSEKFELTINGNKQKEFSYGSVTEYAAVPFGVYTFVVSFPNGTQVAAVNASINSGAVDTFIFNGDGSTLTPYVIQTVFDENYFDEYTNCYVRVLNSVADPDYSALTPVFAPKNIVLFENVTYGTPTEYVELAIGTYTVYFAQDDATPEEIVDSASITLVCVASEFYTLVYQGLPKSVSTPLSGDGETDKASKPYYEQSEIRVDLLSTSYTEFLFVLFDGVSVGSVAYGTPTAYLPVTSETVNITLVGSSGKVWEDTLQDLSPGQTYSYFVVGVAESQDYPIDGLLTDDSGSEEPTTTTTTGTTTTGTTGTTGSQDDDDDDDDLSGGEIAGIVIGVLVGVALLGGILFWVVRRQRRSQFSTIG